MLFGKNKDHDEHSAKLDAVKRELTEVKAELSAEKNTDDHRQQLDLLGAHLYLRERA